MLRTLSNIYISLILFHTVLMLMNFVLANQKHAWAFEAHCSQDTINTSVPSV